MMHRQIHVLCMVRQKIENEFSGRVAHRETVENYITHFVILSKRYLRIKCGLKVGRVT